MKHQQERSSAHNIHTQIASKLPEVSKALIPALKNISDEKPKGSIDRKGAWPY